MAHAILKEGSVTIMDIAEVLRQTMNGTNDVMDRANDAGLQVAVATFSWVALYAVRTPSLILWLNAKDSTLHSMVRGVLSRMDSEIEFPVRVPLAVVLSAFADRLIETGELWTVFRAFRALSFERNIEQLKLRIVRRVALQF
jgi:hypothetical protein